MTASPIAPLVAVRAIRTDRAMAELCRCKRLATEAMARRDRARRQLEAHKLATAARIAKAYAQLVGQAAEPHRIEAVQRRIDDLAADGQRMADALAQAEAALRGAFEDLETAHRALVTRRRSQSKLESLDQRIAEAQARAADLCSEIDQDDLLFDRRAALAAASTGAEEVD